MEDVIIASYDQSGDVGAEVPSESFSVNFAKIELDYTPTKSDGGTGSSVRAGGHVQSGGQFVASVASSGPGAVAGAVAAGEFQGFGGDCKPGGGEH